MRKTIKGLERELRIERKNNDYLRDELYKERRDRGRLREWISSKFTWWLDLISKGQKPCLKYLIEDKAIILGMKK